MTTHLRCAEVIYHRTYDPRGAKARSILVIDVILSYHCYYLVLDRYLQIEEVGLCLRRYSYLV